jgi:hypothetical protein
LKLIVFVFFFKATIKAQIMPRRIISPAVVFAVLGVEGYDGFGEGETAKLGVAELARVGWIGVCDCIGVWLGLQVGVTAGVG